MNNLNQNQPKTKSILGEKKIVVNIGLKIFADSMVSQGAEVVNVNWSPPQKSKNDLEKILDELL